MKNEKSRPVQPSLPGLQMEEEIEGVVERIVFTNEATPFTVFSFKPLRKNSRITPSPMSRRPSSASSCACAATGRHISASDSSSRSRASA
mgnify:CR=1 FL=1